MQKCTALGQVLRRSNSDQPPVGADFSAAGAEHRGFFSNERLAHLPRQAIAGEAPGDLFYIRGWGNLAFFRSGYFSRDDLILLNKIEGPLFIRCSHRLQLNLLS